MPVESITPGDRRWPALAAHLDRAGMTRWALPPDDQPPPGVCFLGVPIDARVVGHISILAQPITVPATAWSGDKTHTMPGPDGQPLRETFVQTFAVEEAFRRRGYGRALQQAALRLTRDLGCIQMRSWSSLDKPANHTLKLSLGFGMHPATQEATDGQLISGVYFVKTV